MSRTHEEIYNEANANGEGEAIGEEHMDPIEALEHEGYEVFLEDGRSDGLSVGVKGDDVAIVGCDGCHQNSWAVIVQGSVSRTVTGNTLIETEN